MDVNQNLSWEPSNYSPNLTRPSEGIFYKLTQWLRSKHLFKKLDIVILWVYTSNCANRMKHGAVQFALFTAQRNRSSLKRSWYELAELACSFDCLCYIPGTELKQESFNWNIAKEQYQFNIRMFRSCTEIYASKDFY